MPGLTMAWTLLFKQWLRWVKSKKKKKRQCMWASCSLHQGLNLPHWMSSNVFIQVLEGHTSCRELSAPWDWMSTYSSINPQLWGTLVCSGNDTSLEQMLLTPFLPVIEKVKGCVLKRFADFKLCYYLTKNGNEWLLQPNQNVFTGPTVGWCREWNCNVQCHTLHSYGRVAQSIHNLPAVWLCPPELANWA